MLTFLTRSSAIKSFYEFMKLPQARLRDLISARLKKIYVYYDFPAGCGMIVACFDGNQDWICVSKC